MLFIFLLIKETRKDKDDDNEWTNKKLYIMEKEDITPRMIKTTFLC